MDWVTRPERALAARFAIQCCWELPLCQWRRQSVWLFHCVVVTASSWYLIKWFLECFKATMAPKDDETDSEPEINQSPAEAVNQQGMFFLSWASDEQLYLCVGYIVVLAATLAGMKFKSGKSAFLLSIWDTCRQREVLLTLYATWQVPVEPVINWIN